MVVKLSRGCWEQNPGPLQEQQMILIIDVSLQLLEWIVTNMAFGTRNAVILFASFLQCGHVFFEEQNIESQADQCFPKDVYILLPDTCEYVPSHGKGELRLTMELRLFIDELILK